MTDRVRVDLRGDAELHAALNILGVQGQMAIARAIYESAEKIMAASKRIVPIDTTTLQKTGHVQVPKMSGGLISCRLGYGGAAAPYALEQHENLDFKHKPGRQAKYLEGPALAMTPEIPREIGKQVRAACKKVAARR